MKKKTKIIALVCALVIIAILAVVIFSDQLFDNKGESNTESTAHSSEVSSDVQGVDDGTLGGDKGVEGAIPGVADDNENFSEASLNGMKTIAEADGAKLLAEDKAFKDDVEGKISKLGILNKNYSRAKAQVRGFASKYVVYNVTTKSGGKNIAPDGVAKLTIKIPNSYNLDKVQVYFLADKGIAKLDCNVDKQNKTAVVGYTKSGVYILTEKKDADNSTSSKKNTSKTTSKTASKTSSKTKKNTSNTSSTASKNNSSTGSSTTSVDSGSSSSSDTSSTEKPQEEKDPNKDTMSGWTPWR